jgi:hypothetical protein
MPRMSEQTKTLLIESNDLVLQLTKKQLETNLSLYMDNRRDITKKLRNIVVDKSILSQRSLASHLIPDTLDYTRKTRRFFKQLHTAFVAQMKTIISECLQEQMTAELFQVPANPPPHKRQRSMTATSPSIQTSPRAESPILENMDSTPSIPSSSMKDVRIPTISGGSSVSDQEVSSSASVSRESSPSSRRSGTRRLNHRTTSSTNIPPFKPVHSRSPSVRVSAVQDSSIGRSRNSSMKIVSADEAVTELLSIPLSSVPLPSPFSLPDSSPVHKFDNSVTKDRFIDRLRNSVTHYNDTNAIIVQFVCDANFLPPTAHFSCNVPTQFLEQNLTWLIPPMKSIIVEVFIDSDSFLPSLDCTHLSSWSLKHNISIILTMSESISQSVHQILKSTLDKDVILSKRPFH